MAALPELVNHPLHLVQLLAGEPPVPREGREEGGQRAAEFLFHQLVYLRRLHLVARDKGAHNAVLVHQHAALGQALYNRVGRRRLPAQTLPAECHQLAAAHRLVLPEYEAEAIFALKNFRGVHINAPLIR